jgi:hypothetical protein
MPLQEGKSKKVLSENISEVMSSYNDKGTIGNTKPKNKAHAAKIEAAIAYAQQRKSA